MVSGGSCHNKEGAVRLVVVTFTTVQIKVHR